MGSLLSTRWGGHARRRTIGEALLVVRVRELAAPAGRGVLEWRGVRAAIGSTVASESGEPGRSVRLTWAVRPAGGGAARPREVRLYLSPTSLRFGVRWWVQCPGCGRRRGALYLSTAAQGWRCRVCAGLAYHSQRLAPFDRLAQRAGVMARRLGGAEWPPGLSPGKPPRMHWRTYARHLEALEAVERARDAEWMIGAARLVGHIDAAAARRLRRVRPAGLTT